MQAPQRDLASIEVWDRSLERSRRRRVLAAQGRYPRRAAFYANRTLQVIKVSGAGPDHPWQAHVQESRYLKAAFCRVE